MIDSDLSEIVPEDVEAKVKEAAEISMGTEISVEDIDNIQMLCDQVCLLKNALIVCVILIFVVISGFGNHDIQRPALRLPKGTNDCHRTQPYHFGW